MFIELIELNPNANTFTKETEEVDEGKRPIIIVLESILNTNTTTEISPSHNTSTSIVPLKRKKSKTTPDYLANHWRPLGSNPFNYMSARFKDSKA